MRSGRRAQTTPSAGPDSAARNKLLLQIAAQQMFWLLESYEHLVEPIEALDPFAGSGLLMSHTYIDRCHHADLWELDPIRARQAMRLGANVSVHCGDSIAAVRSGDRRLKEYNFIMLDNNIGGCYGPERRYCEHFEMIPAIFRYLRKGRPAVVVVNYVPDVDRLAADPRFIPDTSRNTLADARPSSIPPAAPYCLQKPRLATVRPQRNRVGRLLTMRSCPAIPC